MAAYLNFGDLICIINVHEICIHLCIYIRIYTNTFRNINVNTQYTEMSLHIGISKPIKPVEKLSIYNWKAFRR